MPQGPETRLIDAARRARQAKLSPAEAKRLDALLSRLEGLLMTPAERQAAKLTAAPNEPPSHSGQTPSPQPEFANTR